MRVLICDDEPDIRLLFRHGFTRAGAEVHEAPNGEEAIAAVTTVVPDLVVLDVGLPGIDGIATLAALRDAVPGLRIVLVTATIRPEDETRALELGAEACYEKLDFLGRIPTLVEPGT